MEIISSHILSENGFKRLPYEKPTSVKKEVTPNINLHVAIAEALESAIQNSLKKATRHAASHMRYNLRIAGDRSSRVLPPGTIEVSGTQYDGMKYSLSVIAADNHQQKKILVFISEDNREGLLMDQYEVDHVSTTNGSTRLVVDAAPITVAELQSVIDLALGGSSVEIYVTNVTANGKSVDPMMMTQNGY